MPQAAYNREVDRVGVLVGDILLLDSVPVSGDTTGLWRIPFMGLVPGLVGLYQVNFVLPEGTGSGNIPVRMGRDLCSGISLCNPDFTYSQTARTPDTIGPLRSSPMQTSTGRPGRVRQ